MTDAYIQARFYQSGWSHDTFTLEYTIDNWATFNTLATYPSSLVVRGATFGGASGHLGHTGQRARGTSPQRPSVPGSSPRRRIGMTARAASK